MKSISDSQDDSSGNRHHKFWLTLWNLKATHDPIQVGTQGRTKSLRKICIIIHEI